MPDTDEFETKSVRRLHADPVNPWILHAFTANIVFRLTREAAGEAFTQLPENVNDARSNVLCHHARLLIDFLLSNDCTRKGESLDRLLPNFRSPAIDQLRFAYGDAATEGSPNWMLSGMPADPESKRCTNQQCVQALMTLMPLVERAWQDIEALCLDALPGIEEPIDINLIRAVRSIQFVESVALPNELPYVKLLFRSKSEAEGFLELFQRFIFSCSVLPYKLARSFDEAL